MIDWLALFRRKKPAPLSGAPAVRRQKNYSADSGYVYQYFYDGFRPADRAGAQGIDYVFDVSADRHSSFPVTVFVADPAIQDWEREHGRELSATERYAVAKLALFQAFDERAAPAEMREPVHVRQADLAGILERLDVE
ncbi:MAG: hypothetical protein KIT09_33430 [Bryobacteraceae bacterium]|nr:hypothetical protein [Bryobacteraceae bacterium]